MIWIKFLWSCSQVHAKEFHWKWANFGSVNGLAPSGITWANVDPDLSHQMASLGHHKYYIFDKDMFDAGNGLGNISFIFLL